MRPKPREIEPSGKEIATSECVSASDGFIGAPFSWNEIAKKAIRSPEVRERERERLTVNRPENHVVSTTGTKQTLVCKTARPALHSLLIPLQGLHASSCATISGADRRTASFSPPGSALQLTPLTLASASLHLSQLFGFSFRKTSESPLFPKTL